MLPELSKEDAEVQAQRYDFFGGQIENVTLLVLFCEDSVYHPILHRLL